MTITRDIQNKVVSLCSKRLRTLRNTQNYVLMGLGSVGQNLDSFGQVGKISWAAKHSGHILCHNPNPAPPVVYRYLSPRRKCSVLLRIDALIQQGMHETTLME